MGLFDPKKPAFWVMVAVLLAVAAVLLLVFTDTGRSVKTRVVFNEIKEPIRLPDQAGKRLDLKKALELTTEDEDRILRLLGSTRWEQGEMTPEVKYRVKALEKVYFYSHEGHIFFDEKAEKYLTLSFDEWADINAMLGLEEVTFELPNAVGGSNDRNVRIGVASVGFPQNGDIEVIWDNISSREYYYGGEISLWKKSLDEPSYNMGMSFFTDGFWLTTIFMREDYGIESIGYIIDGHSFTRQKYSLEAFGDLEPGEYRLYFNTGVTSDWWVDLTLEHKLYANYSGARCSSDNGDIALHVTDITELDGDVEVAVLWQNFGDSSFEAPYAFRFGRVVSDNELLEAEDRVTDEVFYVHPGEEMPVEYRIRGGASLPAGEYVMRMVSSGNDLRIVLHLDHAARRTAELMEKYPEYFEIENAGLTIFVLDEGEMRFTIGDITEAFEYSRMDVTRRIRERGLTAEEVKLVLAYYPAYTVREIVPVSPVGEPDPEIETETAKALLLLYGDPEPEGEEREKRIEELRKQMPQYFDIPTEEGIDVFVWQMARGSLSFCLAEHTEEEPGFGFVNTQTAVGIIDMKLILSTYDIDPANIVIRPTSSSFSNYGFTCNYERYIEGVRDLLGI